MAGAVLGAAGLTGSLSMAKGQTGLYVPPE